MVGVDLCGGVMVCVWRCSGRVVVVGLCGCGGLVEV